MDDEAIVVVRKARIADVKPIHYLLMEWASKEMLLPRSLSQLYTHVREFFVIESQNKHTGEKRIIGCCALSIIWEDLAEIRSLAVMEDCCGRGYGRLLMDEAEKEARELGLKRLFALTYQVAFFEHMGFAKVSKDTLPQKVWSDCINCPRFPDCDEVAVARTL